MRRIFLAGVAVAALVMIAHADTLLDLGVKEADARAAVIQAAVTSPEVFGARAFKAASPAQKAVLVRGILTWAKAFTQAPLFKTGYEKTRNNFRPDPPKGLDSYADQLKQQRAEIDKNEAEVMKNPSLSPEMRKSMAETFAKVRAQLDAQEKNPKQMKMMEDAIAQGGVAQQAEYTKRLARFEQQYPADPSAAIAKQLHRFLNECADVDFNARLEPAGGGQMKFADAKFEDKSSEWKLCFRAGREPLDAARTFAQAWLKELGR